LWMLLWFLSKVRRNQLKICKWYNKLERGRFHVSVSISRVLSDFYIANLN
jgi:hypothetical protein